MFFSPTSDAYSFPRHEQYSKRPCVCFKVLCNNGPGNGLKSNGEALRLFQVGPVWKQSTTSTICAARLCRIVWLKSECRDRAVTGCDICVFAKARYPSPFVSSRKVCPAKYIKTRSS